jgi:hypothetical protein
VAAGEPADTPGSRWGSLSGSIEASRQSASASASVSHGSSIVCAEPPALEAAIGESRCSTLVVRNTGGRSVALACSIEQDADSRTWVL